MNSTFAVVNAFIVNLSVSLQSLLLIIVVDQSLLKSSESRPLAGYKVNIHSGVVLFLGSYTTVMTRK